MRGGGLRTLLRALRRWPLHPQWLLDEADQDRELSRALSSFEGTVLDVGCANARLSKLLPAECRYVGLDYPGTALALYGTRPHVFGDACRLPFADASIGAVILKDVLEHVRGPELALAEIARVTRPDGRLLLWIPFLYPIHDAPHDYQRFTRHGLSAYVGGHGFQVMRIATVLGGVETAGLMASLALADACEQIVARRRVLLPLVPLLGALVLVCNLAARCLSWLPRSQFMPAFYRVDAVRKAT